MQAETEPVVEAAAPSLTGVGSPAPAKPKKLIGFTCPDCPRAKLEVYKTRRPIAGRVARYRKCVACGYRITTVEHLGRVLPRTGAPRPVPVPKVRPPAKPRRSKYPVVLTAAERTYVAELVARATVAAKILTRARVLLAADEADGRPARTVKQLVAETGIGYGTIGNVCKTLAGHTGDERIWRTLFSKPAAEQSVSEAA